MKVKAMNFLHIQAVLQEKKRESISRSWEEPTGTMGNRPWLNLIILAQ